MQIADCWDSVINAVLYMSLPVHAAVCLHQVTVWECVYIVPYDAEDCGAATALVKLPVTRYDVTLWLPGAVICLPGCGLCASEDWWLCVRRLVAMRLKTGG